MPTRIHVIDYDESHVAERVIDDVPELAALSGSPSIAWINVEGLSDRPRIEALARTVRLHTLTLEDILNGDLRPKLEDYGDYLFVTAKMLEVDQVSQRIVVDQLSLVLGASFVISAQEHPGDPFDPVRSRIRTAAGRIRRSGPDYLVYALLDLTVDQYFAVVDWIGDRIEHLDEQMAGNERPELLRVLYQLKRDLIFLRRAVNPLRDVVAGLRHAETDKIRESTTPYLRDLFEHLVQVSERIDTYRDLLAGVQDMYVSRMSNRTNTVMKIIAVFSSIFLPLNFITGVFGMNFEFMPLLHSHWGVLAAFGCMLVVVLVMLGYFRRRRWI
ncbi:MAG: magnesium/cobalt transporter CorA [Burkholderiales bacterium]|nr:magnesium/cobalt transporter CorA [Burkholderiales bacterium]